MKFTGTVEGTPGIVSLNIGVSEDDTHKMLTISIKDNGIGMTPEFLSNMFEDYAQAESGTARKFGGTGLGLSICKTLSDLMKGHIKVTSEVGLGSEFKVSLPIEPISNFKSDWPALNDIECQISIKTNDLKSHLTNYLSAYGVELENPDANIIILEHNEKENSISELTDAYKQTSQIKDLKLSDNRLHEMGTINPSLSIVENNPMNIESFHKQLAILGGKIEAPQTRTNKKEGNSTMAPNREGALEEGTLILVADDNKVNLTVIKRQLSILGYACDTADDGEIALDMWAKTKYALLITDWHMPNLNGWDLARKIREREKSKDLPRVPIIAATGTLIESDDESFTTKNIDLQLMKPLEMAKLKAALVSHMGNTKS